MSKMNCWEFMKCGRQAGGENADEQPCSIATENSADGLNGGINGGRMCWVISENCCEYTEKASNTQRRSSCFQCEFRYKVLIEEGLLNSCREIGSYLTSSAEYKKKEAAGF